MQRACHRSASTLIAIVALVFPAASCAAPSRLQYACGASEILTVERDARTARVRLGDRTYPLERTRSSIGDHYISASAALIIDGASAVFVTDKRPDLGSCTETTSVASDR